MHLLSASTYILYSPLIIALILLHGQQFCQCDRLLPTYQIPEPFSEQLLPIEQRSGQLISNLGHVLHLNTLLPPKNVSEFNTKFTLYTRHHTPKAIKFQPRGICVPGTCYGPFQYNLNALASSGFNASARTVVMISGFLTGDRVNWMQRAKDLWLQLEDVNVILVSWSAANRYIYSVAVADTPIVARQTTVFLYYLAKLHGVDLFADASFAKRLHFVGHSLGAHIAAFVGQDLNGRLGRITGLDPAGPSFDNQPARRRLDRGDALLVDVIHTNAGQMNYANAMAAAIYTFADKYMHIDRLVDSIVPHSSENMEQNAKDTFWYGIDVPIGHLDYYANNGRMQPGCDDAMHMCDHSRAHEIYEEILAYELDLKRYKSTRGERRLANRLMAFGSQSYESFEMGASLLSGQCEVSWASDSQVTIESALCLVPIDLLTPVDILRQELATSYAVDFTSETADIGRKYYFKTQAEKPLLGDHYLLKLYLDESTSAWSSSCELEAEISVRSLSDPVAATVKVTNSSKLVNSENFYGIATPFVHPRGCEARDALNNLLQSPRENLSRQSIYDIAPLSLRLSISEIKKAPGLGETIKTKISGWFGLTKILGPSQTTCSLSINSIAIVPVGSTIQPSLEFLYGQRSVSMSDTDKLLLMTPAEVQNKRQTKRRVARELSAATDKPGILDVKLDGIVM